MTRMFVTVPSAPTETNHTVVYFGNGTMLDMGQDARCGTCKFFHRAVDDDYSYCTRLVTFGDMLLVDPDFGCVKWEAKGE